MSCEHPEFDAKVHVHKFRTPGSEAAGFRCEVTVRCKRCGDRFKFMGGAPSPDMLTLHCTLTPMARPKKP
jgi:hypothetical protein